MADSTFSGAISKYLEVVGKPYRVYFFLRSVECIDAYFFSTADEGSKEVEKRRKKAWERVKKDVSLANTRCE